MKTKLKISDDIWVELEFPVEITLNEMKDTINDINNFSKLMITAMSRDNELKDPFNPNSFKSKIKKRKYNTKRIPLFNDRNFVIKALKAHYIGTKEDRKQIIEELKPYVVYEYEELSKRFSNLIIRHEINPEEIGLKDWPRKGWRNNNIN